jgi:hypothetical protein
MSKWKASTKLEIFIHCHTIRLCVAREEHRRRVFESRVLRRIFGPKRDEVMGE